MPLTVKPKAPRGSNRRPSNASVEAQAQMAAYMWGQDLEFKYRDKKIPGPNDNYKRRKPK